MATLLESVARLHAWRESRDPAWEDTLGPGLSDAEIDSLMAPFAPLRMPEDLRALYRWRNGEEGMHCLFDRRFLPLEEAIQQHRFAVDDLDQNPLLFAFCDAYNDRYAVELANPSLRLSPVYALPHQDPNVYLSFTSLERLAETTLQSLLSGGFVLEDDEWEVDEAVYERIRAELNPGVYVFGESERRGENVFDGVGTRDWPQRWLMATGRGSESILISGERCSLRDMEGSLRHGASGPFHVAGRVTSLTSTGAEALYGLSDTTAQVDVFCDHADSVREVTLGADVEAEVVATGLVTWTGGIARLRARAIRVLEHWQERRPPIVDEFEADRTRAAKLRRARRNGVLVHGVPNRGGTSISGNVVLGAAETAADAIASVELEVDASLKWLIWVDGPFESGAALLQAFHTNQFTRSYRIEGVEFDVNEYARRRAELLFAAYPREAGEARSEP